MTRCALLVTGFGPFPGVPDNPSSTVVRAIERQGWRGVRTRLLPTEWAVCGEIGALVCEADRVLMFGVATSARRIRYEGLARPVASRSPDAVGLTAHATPLHSRRTALPVVTLASEARLEGFPVVTSRNAGAYICNASYAAALGRNPRTLFVHIPPPKGRGVLGEEGLAAHALWLTARLLGRSERAGVHARLARRGCRQCR